MTMTLVLRISMNFKIKQCYNLQNSGLHRILERMLSFFNIKLQQMSSYELINYHSFITNIYVI